MAGFWMVRAGEGGYLAREFVEKGCVGVGFDMVGPFDALTTLEAMRERVRVVYPDLKPSSAIVAAGVGHKFRNVMQVGDYVVTYDPKSRQYHVGRITGPYAYRPGYLTDYAHVRPVEWIAAKSRDALSLAARNTLGAIVTIFEPGEEVLAELLGERPIAPVPSPEAPVDRPDYVTILEDTLSRAHEFIADRITELSPHEMEQLLAALLRALGFKARVTPIGPDRGRDVIASPDGLGLQSPRIFCEVKHRKGAIGAPDVRSFTSTLRGEDRGVFLSTGGFTKEARYEGERAHVPVTLMDLDELVRLVTENYEQFDTVGRSLLPLARVYWPLP